ncbi:MAG TPA: HAD family phosphatase [Candidatus Limnocylindria bacterium]|nr:HAD family phosphatase [Candidatus Limnocylindria bacterium]
MSLADLSPPRALIFDLDGTLVDTVPTRIEAWLRTFTETGIAAERDHVGGLMGADGRRVAHKVAQHAGRQLSEQEAERIDRRSGEIYSELNRDPQPLPGARQLLLALDEAGFTWAIATSSRPEQVMASVDALRLPRRPHITDGSHVQHAKPAPDLLLHAARELGLRPAECWYVGDSVWDVLAARAAGLPAVAVTSGSTSAEELRGAGADAVSGPAEIAAELARRGLLAAEPARRFG